MNSHKRVNVTLPNEIIDRLTKYRDSKTGFDSFNLSAFVSFKLDEYLTNNGFPKHREDNYVPKKVQLHDIDVEHYTDKLERMIDISEHPEPSSLQASQKEVKKTKDKSIKKPIQTEPEPLHKAPIPIHEHIHKLHSEPISEPKESVTEYNFFDKEPEPTEKLIEEPIEEISTTFPIVAWIGTENTKKKRISKTSELKTEPKTKKKLNTN